MGSEGREKEATSNLGKWKLEGRVLRHEGSWQDEVFSLQLHFSVKANT